MTGEDIAHMPAPNSPSWDEHGRSVSSIAEDGVRAAIDRDATWIVIVAGILAIITVGVVIAIDGPGDQSTPVAGVAAPAPPPEFPPPSAGVSVPPPPQPSTPSAPPPAVTTTMQATTVDQAVRR